LSIVEFPYILHKGYLLPLIPIIIFDHIFWVYVDSGATYTILNAREAEDIGFKWWEGKKEMIVVGDGSFIPIYLHQFPIKIDKWEVITSIGFSDRLGVGFNLLGRSGIFNQFRVCFNEDTSKITFEKI
jgi:predicted aspartyl protease